MHSVVITNKKRRHSAILKGAVGALLCLLIACSNELTPVEQGNRDGILHYSNGYMPYTLNPHRIMGAPSFRMATVLFEGLTAVNPYTLKVEPGVAKTWDISDDRRIYTFHLNDDAKWSNGDPITAQDYVWSWEYMLSPKEGNRHSSMLYVIHNAREFAAGEVDKFDDVGVMALDDKTLQITLANPAPYFLQLLANPGAYALHRASVERYGSADAPFSGWTHLDHFVGNGPFTLSSFEPGVGFTLNKSTSYWDRNNVKLKQLKFYIMDDPEDEYQQFNAGNLHYTQFVPTNKLSILRNQPNSGFRQTLYFSTYYYIFNIKRPPLSDIRVRKALLLAIDRDRLNEQAFSNSMQVANSFTPPGVKNYYPRELATYNPEKARKLLAEAGFPNGEGWPTISLSLNDTEVHRHVAKIVTEMWRKELNIDVKVEPVVWQDYRDRLDARNYDIARVMWIGDYVDPHAFLSIFITDGGFNRTGFSNERYDNIVLREALAAKTKEQRNALYTEAETLLMENAPLIPLFYSTSKHMVHSSVKGITPNVLDHINFKYVQLENAQ